MTFPVALQGDMTDPKFGPPGQVNSITPTVMIEGRPAATIGSIVTPHGNPHNPKAPGFNPKCAVATIVEGTPTIMVEGKPLAYITAKCSCGYHQIAAIGSPTVHVGI